MSEVMDFLERSLISSITPEQKAQRRNDILRSKSFIKRAGGLALHRFATKHPKLTSVMLSRDPDTRGLEYVGQGYHSIVYRGKDEVIKVNFRSVGMTEAERLDMANRQADDYQQLREFVGKIALDQRNFVGEHPIKKDKRAVQIGQPYCQYNQLGVFSHRLGEVDVIDLENDTDEHPGLANDLREMIENANKMYDDTGLVPDTLGRGNLGEKEHRLVLVDGQPIGRDNPRLQLMIMNQLEDLAGNLDKIGR